MIEPYGRVEFDRLHPVTCTTHAILQVKLFDEKTNLQQTIQNICENMQDNQLLYLKLMHKRISWLNKISILRGNLEPANQ